MYNKQYNIYNVQEHICSWQLDIFSYQYVQIKQFSKYIVPTIFYAYYGPENLSNFLYAQTNFMFQYRIFHNLQKQNNPQSKIRSLNYLSNNDILINVKQCFK